MQALNTEPPLADHRLRNDILRSHDRIEMIDTAPLKPKPGLNGPPAWATRIQLVLSVDNMNASVSGRESFERRGRTWTRSPRN